MHSPGYGARGGVQTLRREIEGQVFDDEETLQAVQSDFGRIIRKMPRAVVVPASQRDVCKVIQFALQKGWTVSTRGASCSQGGQSLSQEGILLDMSGLNSIETIERDCAWVQAGVEWGALVQATSERGLVPPVLTDNLNVTVGGTLSTAGIGVASHRYGIQADHVDELEVVTGEGHLVRCSPLENAELFDCTRCGLGQFSIITRARLRLRPFANQLRSYFLLYDDLDALTRDQARMMKEQRFDFVDSWCAPCHQGFRRLGEGQVSFAEWFYPVRLTVEYGGKQPRDEVQLGGLKFYRRVKVEDFTFVEFARRCEPLFALWKETGAWPLAHPGMQVVLPWRKATAYIEGVLKSFPPHLLAGGVVSLQPCRTDISRTPLFMHPAGDFAVGFGILPSVPKPLLPVTMALVDKASELSMQIGGKSCLSGWIQFDHQCWKEHFGETWSKIVEWKRFYDPKGVLNPGVVKYR